MSVQRFIATSFWDDDWVQSLRPLEKLLYLYLLTNPLTTIAGIYKITLRRMNFDTGIPEGDIEAALCSFSSDGKAFFNLGYIVIPAWPAHQRLDDRPTLRKGVDAILDSLSPEMLNYLREVSYRYDTPKIPIRYPYDTHKVSIPYGYEPCYSDTDTDTDTDTDSEVSIAKAECSQPVDNSPKRRQEAIAMLDAVFPVLAEAGQEVARVHDPPASGANGNEW